MTRCVSKLGLGTVQWGCQYGISNQAGKTSLEEVALILQRARYNDIATIDTASMYGDAEAVLGAHELTAFKVVTKTPRFGIDSTSPIHASQLRTTYFNSLSKLGLDSTYGLLMHGANDLLMPGGILLLDELCELRNRGLVRKIGVSVYDSTELDAVLALWTPDIVQLPLSVFDQRLITSGHLKRLKDLDVEVHVRSVFLQGLLLMPLQRIPAFFNPITELIARWHDATREQSMSPAEAALSFVRDLPEVDTVLVGVESVSQLDEILSSFSINRTFVAHGLSCDDARFLNPGLWRIQQ